ncbi:TPA: hypothetical protein ACQUH6_001121 [Neisseria polysaccharea]|uniref:hypothetical protein n=1 Tax=Neisseria polysaccharea TaxID=489 RepID=UPI0027E07C70|nr:hypothetical protein [Neisseria polysaccharea]
MKFEDKISEIQKRMLSLALEFSGEGVTAVYIYGARERNVLSFDAFFKVDNKIMRKESFNTKEIQWQFLNLGMEDYSELCSVFAENHQEIPTQLKLIYDNVNQKASANYSYEKFFSHRDDLIPGNIFEQWFKEEKQKTENPYG